MNIILDLDNTLVYNSVVDDVISEFGLNTIIHKYDLSDLPIDARDECFARFNDSAIMNQLSPFEYSVGVDSRIKSNGKHTLHVVTARSASITEGTSDMVYRLFPLVDSVCVVDGADKTNTFNKLNADVVVDDHVDYVMQALDAGVPYVYMVSNDKTTYNHRYVDDVRAMGGRVFNTIKDVFDNINI